MCGGSFLRCCLTMRDNVDEEQVGEASSHRSDEVPEVSDVDTSSVNGFCEDKAGEALVDIEIELQELDEGVWQRRWMICLVAELTCLLASLS